MYEILIVSLGPRIMDISNGPEDIYTIQKWFQYTLYVIYSNISRCTRISLVQLWITLFLCFLMDIQCDRCSSSARRGRTFRRARALSKRTVWTFCASSPTNSTSAVPWRRWRASRWSSSIWNCVTTIYPNCRVSCFSVSTFVIWPFTTAVWPSWKSPPSVPLVRT